MKWKVFRIIFRKELEAMNKTVIRQREEAQNEIKKIKYEMDKMKKQYGLVKRIFSIDPHVKIVGIETNKAGEEVLVTEWVTDSMLWIKLYGPSYQAINNLPRIMSTIRKNSNYIKIEDIIMEDNCIGNGSIAMKYFLKAAEQLKIDYIKGDLSSVDKDHFDRSEAYYKKFNFDVVFDEDRTSGTIKKIMK